MSYFNKSMLTATVLMGSTSLASAGGAANVAEMFTKADADLFLRYRVELVDQNGFDKDATASTLLTKLTYKSATLNGFSFVLEGTHTTVLGAETYNSTVNGNSTRPVVADPETTEFNQGYLSYKRGGFALKAGRQGINIGNQRFIGTVGFRQNDQTYDSVLVSASPTEGVKTSYAYIWNVNRIFGEDHPLGDLDTNAHVLNASYNMAGVGKLSTYAYLLDMNDAAVYGLSSQTFGARFAGKRKVSDAIMVGYELEYAKQSDYKDNPSDYSADYFHGASSLAGGGFTAAAGYELLGSDHGVSFKTPLATLHKFNGWADKFLGTPAAGLQDLYVSLAYKVPKGSVLGGLLMKAVYHDFSADVGGASYGSELDLLVSKKITKHLSASVKAAFYNAATHASDTNKIWFTLQAKF
jgi:hypothetical protein